MNQGTNQDQVWGKNFEPKIEVEAMFSIKMQPPFLYPNLNILKIWGCSDVCCKRFEGNVAHCSLGQYIVCQKVKILKI